MRMPAVLQGWHGACCLLCAACCLSLFTCSHRATCLLTLQSFRFYFLDACCACLQVVVSEAEELVAKFGTPRRTAIVADGAPVLLPLCCCPCAGAQCRWGQGRAAHSRCGRPRACVGVLSWCPVFMGAGKGRAPHSHCGRWCNCDGVLFSGCWAEHCRDACLHTQWSIACVPYLAFCPAGEVELRHADIIPNAPSLCIHETAA